MKRIMGRMFLMGLAVLAGIAGQDWWTEAAHAASAVNDSVLIKLPAPDEMGGKTLRECLNLRRTNRDFNRSELDMQTMANLFWAAWGINCEDGRRVVPTGRNRQLHTVYAVRGDGVWEYLPKEHAMRRVLEGDRRDRFDGSACILLYAGDARDPYVPMSAGAMFQDVGLYSAAAGLHDCVKATHRDALDAELNLPEGWRTLVTHSISRP